MRSQDETFGRELEWLREFTPATRSAAEGASYPPGLHPLPDKVKDRAARYLLY